MTLYAKILLYNLSLVPLYFLFIIKKVDVTGIECIFQEYSNLEFYKIIVLNNIPTLLLVGLILISVLAFKKLTSELTSGYGLPETFSDLDNIDFNHLTFIATYILPLLAFTLDGLRDMIFIIVLLIFIGIIYIKTNLYYLSPVFIIFGIKIYSAIDEDGKKVVLMTEEENLKTTESLQYTQIGDIYFAKRKKA